MKRCVITGASGFIGRALTDRLIHSDMKVRILTRKPEKVQHIWPNQSIEIIKADLATVTQNTLERSLQNTDVLFHCAGEINKTELMQTVNCEGTLKLCLAAAGRIRRWIQLSSVGVYGPYRTGVVKEDAPLAPCGPYETTKTIGDLQVQKTALSGGFSYTLIRPSTVFGPKMPNQSLFQLIGAVARGYFFYIGHNEATANYIHVDNVIECLLSASQSKNAKNQTYLLSDCCALKDLISTIALETGKPNRFPIIPEMPTRFIARIGNKLPGFPLTESRVDALTGRAKYSTQKISDELGYRCIVPTLDGIRKITLFWKKEMANLGRIFRR